MDQKELDEYWHVFKTAIKNATVQDQRKVSLAYCELVVDRLDGLGRKALLVVREHVEGKVTERRRLIWQRKLQAALPIEGFSPYSPLIWALMPDGPSYPPYYAAAIAGLNLPDLQIASLPELGRLALEIVSMSQRED